MPAARGGPGSPSVFASVVQAFKEFDLAGDGSVDRKIFEYLLLSLGPDVFDPTSVDLLLNTFAGVGSKQIPYEKFLEWCSVGADAQRQASDTVRIVIRREDGARIFVVGVKPSDTVLQAKRKVAKHFLATLAFDAAPLEQQRLLAAGRELRDGDVVQSASAAGGRAGAAATPAAPTELELQLAHPPPLSLLDFVCVVAGDAVDVGRALALAFCGRSVTHPLSGVGSLASRPASQGTSPGRGPAEGSMSDMFDNASGLGAELECGATPLERIPGIRAKPNRLAAATRWLLAQGAADGIAGAASLAGAIDGCLRQCNAAVLRVLLAVEGAEPLTWEQAVHGIFSASHGLCRLAYKDFALLPGDDQARLDRREAIALLQVETAVAQGLADFVDLLRKEILPGLTLPSDLLDRPALISDEEVILGEPGSPGSSLLLAAAHGGHCWALAELARHGVPWKLPNGGAKGKPGALSVHALRSASMALEDQLRANIRAAELRLAVLQGDVATIRRLQVEDACAVLPTWSEGLLVTAARCGANAEVIEALLGDANADPNIGRYEYERRGAFDLRSALGCLAASASSLQKGGVTGDALDRLVERLVLHPRTDLDFGCVTGAASRAECVLETPAQCFRRAECWQWLHWVLLAGASPSSSDKDPRLSANGGDWGKVDPSAAWGASTTEWLDSLERDLKRAQSSGQADQRRSATRLALWLRRVRKQDFAFPEVNIYPAPFRKVAATMVRGLAQRSGPRRPALPLRAVERVLSFVGFWDFPTGRPNYLRDLHLRRVDGYSRTCGYAGCPVYECEVLFSSCQLLLGEWAEDAYRAREAPKASPECTIPVA